MNGNIQPLIDIAAKLGVDLAPLIKIGVILYIIAQVVALLGFLIVFGIVISRFLRKDF